MCIGDMALKPLVDGTSLRSLLSGIGWLGNKDSNLERRYQKPLCYHYTIPQQVRHP